MTRAQLRVMMTTGRAPPACDLSEMTRRPKAQQNPLPLAANPWLAVGPWRLVPQAMAMEKPYLPFLWER
jgi:hypothetical protein